MVMPLKLLYYLGFSASALSTVSHLPSAAIVLLLTSSINDYQATCGKCRKPWTKVEYYDHVIDYAIFWCEETEIKYKMEMNLSVGVGWRCKIH